MLIDGVQVKGEGVQGEPVQHGLHGLARPRAVCVCVNALRSAITFWGKVRFDMTHEGKFVVPNTYRAST